jgi:hypothetical protein
MDSGRNRPPELQNDPPSGPIDPELQAIYEGFRQAVEAGMSPQQVADYVFKAIRDEELYILTHSDYDDAIQKRMQDILHVEAE